MTLDEELRQTLVQLSFEDKLEVLHFVVGKLRGADQTEQANSGSDEPEEISRRYLPRLPTMMHEWGIIQPHEQVYIYDHDDQPALLLDEYDVAFNGQKMGINDWAKLIKGWESISVYEYVVVARTGQTLGEMREAYMQQHGLD